MGSVHQQQRNGRLPCILQCRRLRGVHRNRGALSTIASTGATFDQVFGNQPAINDSGRVAFEARQISPSPLSGLFTGNGGATTTIADENRFVNYNDYLSMNNSGQVAFRALQLSTLNEGIFLGSGGAVTTIADTSGIFKGSSARFALR